MVILFIKSNFSTDNIHPFKSGATAIKIFKDNGYFEGEEGVIKESVDNLYKLLLNSYISEFFERKGSNILA
jgi:hypothetical protein